jgi:hypothetical protein
MSQGVKTGEMKRWVLLLKSSLVIAFCLNGGLSPLNAEEAPADSPPLAPTTTECAETLAVPYAVYLKSYTDQRFWLIASAANRTSDALRMRKLLGWRRVNGRSYSLMEKIWNGTEAEAYRITDGSRVLKIFHNGFKPHYRREIMLTEFLAERGIPMLKILEQDDERMIIMKQSFKGFDVESTEHPRSFLSSLFTRAKPPVNFQAERRGKIYKPDEKTRKRLDVLTAELKAKVRAIFESAEFKAFCVLNEIPESPESTGYRWILQDDPERRLYLRLVVVEP